MEEKQRKARGNNGNPMDSMSERFIGYIFCNPLIRFEKEQKKEKRVLKIHF